MLKKTQLTNLELNKILNEKKYYENYKALSIEALKIVQKSRGWISDHLIKEIAKVLKMSPSNLEEIATFYSQIYRQPVGRNVIKYCNSVVCYMLGCNKIKHKLQDILNIQLGKTTFDNKFTLLSISCLGSCHKAPVMMINNDTYMNVEINNIINLLEKYK